VEVKQWEYAFNEEAQSTYSWLLGLIKYCADNNKKLNAQEMATFVKQKTKYKYSDEIVAHLLGSKNYIDSKDSFDFQELKRVNAKKTLLTNAGINSNKSEEVFKDR
ncbi:MAG: hypothetical protein IJT25_00010, partial [Clostridia bacterium]|nr:hypothetical protein [Clostridia bacterium]